ncbi:hypothetical protein [Pararhodonellum marinum]|uniref:hypothetical protein n=1 Tax=Pararhodonellum marinum TaxID=2755358 RepID=UPI0018908890|nr:hypothetical protein [Pararhodonellum marinum]
MIQRCLVILAWFSFFSCQKKLENHAFTDSFELEVVDSTLVIEQDFFLNGQVEVKLIGDSLIAVSSFKSLAISFFRVDGTEYGHISSREFPEAPFSPSSFDVTEFPVLHVLEHRRGTIHKFNVEQKSFIETKKLNLPEGKAPKFINSKFKVLPNGYLVELHSILFSASDPEYYRKCGNLIYIFDNDGEVLDSFLEYPDEYQVNKGSILPNTYLVSNSFGNSINFSFPHEKKIKSFDLTNLEQNPKILHIPNSKYFDFALREADGIITMEERMAGVASPPLNDYFLSIHETKKQLLIQTWMYNKEVEDSREFLTHLITYDRLEGKWMELDVPRKLFELGSLAGIERDTLYFFEGFTINHDHKFIRRAVLKPLKKKTDLQ